MISDLIRLSVSLADWRTHERILKGQPKVDVMFISTIRSEIDRQRLLGFFNSKDSHFGLVRMWLNGVSGHIRVINSTYAEVLTTGGMRKARAQAEDAIEWAVNKGVKTVLFASSTKRLFGDRGEHIKEKFPDVLFTIGDNGTSMMLMNEIEEITKKCGIDLSESKVAILGANGFIGQTMVEFFKKKKSEVIGLGSSIKRLSLLSQKYDIKVVDKFEDIGKVDFVVACTHLEQSKLTSRNIDLIRQDNKKLLVFDMAQPPNVDYDEYLKCSDKIIRLDSADAYSPYLKYVLGPIGYKSTSVSRGVTFGCFSEAFVLTSLLNKNVDVDIIKNMDHFSVNLENVEKIRKLYKKSDTGFICQPPRSYGKNVKSLSLS